MRPCQFGNGAMTGSEHVPNLSHNYPGKLCTSLPLSAGWVSSTLFPHIAIVLCIGPKPQVRGIDARRIVATVANKEAGRNSSSLDQPACDVRVDNWRASPSRLDLAVTNTYASRPQPARPESRGDGWHGSVFINLRPKSFAKRNGEALRKSGILNKVARHIDSLVVDVLARLQLQLRRAPLFLAIPAYSVNLSR